MNRNRGETASSFRIMLDKDKIYEPIAKEDIVVGTKLYYHSSTYVIKKIENGTAYLEASNSFNTRLMFVSINDITKLGSEYKLEKNK